MQDPQNRSESSAESKSLPNLSFVNMKGIYGFLVGNAVKVAWGGLAGAGLGILYLLVSSPTYTARTQILIDPGLTRVVRDQAAEPPSIMDSQQIETELAVLRSEEISKGVIQSLKLADVPDFQVTDSSDLTDAARNEERDALLLEEFQNNLTIRRIGVSYAIDILYTASTPDLAAKIANEVAASYKRFQIESRTKAAEVGSEWLKSRLGNLRQSMNEASRKLQEYRANQDYSIVPSAGPLGTNKQDGGENKRVTLAELESAAATNRLVYDSFMQTYLATVQRQSFPLSNAKVISFASPSLTRRQSRLPVVVFFAILGALAAAAAPFAWRALRAQKWNRG